MNPIDVTVPLHPGHTPFSLEPIKPPLRIVGAAGAPPRVVLRKS